MPKKPEGTKSYPCFLPKSTLTNFLDTLNSTAVPPVIDSSLLTKMSGSARSSLMSALRYLEFIDSEGRVTEKLRKAVAAYGTPDWKGFVAAILLEPYDAIIRDLDLSNGTQHQLYDAFKTRAGIDGQMLDKAVRFYLAMLEEAGVSYSPFFKAKRVGRPGTKKKVKKNAKSKKGQQEDELDADDPFGDLDDPGEEGPSWARFQIPIPPDKGTAHIALPADIDADDWEMVSIMLDAYVKRLMKQ